MCCAIMRLCVMGCSSCAELRHDARHTKGWGGEMKERRVWHGTQPLRLGPVFTEVWQDRERVHTVNERHDCGVQTSKSCRK